MKKITKSILKQIDGKSIKAGYTWTNCNVLEDGDWWCMDSDAKPRAN